LLSRAAEGDGITAGDAGRSPGPQLEHHGRPVGRLENDELVRRHPSSDRRSTAPAQGDGKGSHDGRAHARADLRPNSPEKLARCEPQSGRRPYSARLRLYLLAAFTTFSVASSLSLAAQRIARAAYTHVWHCTNWPRGSWCWDPPNDSGGIYHNWKRGEVQNLSYMWRFQCLAVHDRSGQWGTHNCANYTVYQDGTFYWNWRDLFDSALADRRRRLTDHVQQLQ